MPGRDFAADVKTTVNGVPHYYEFKNWGSSQLGRSESSFVEQITGTIPVINNLDEMKFIFNPSRWKPTATNFRTALQGKKDLIDAIPSIKKDLLFRTRDSDEIIDILSSDEIFNLIIKVK